MHTFNTLIGTGGLGEVGAMRCEFRNQRVIGHLILTAYGR